MTAYALGIELGNILPGTPVRSIRKFPGGTVVSLDGRQEMHLHVFHFAREARIVISDKLLVPSKYATDAFPQAAGTRVEAVRPLGVERVILFSLSGQGSWGIDVALTLRIDLSPGGKAFSIFREEGNRPVMTSGATRSRIPSSPDQLPPEKRYSLLSLPPVIPDGLASLMEERLNGPANEDAPPAGPDNRGPRLLVDHIAGIDPAIAEMLVSSFPGDPERLWAELLRISASLDQELFSWKIFDLPGTTHGDICHIYPVDLPFESRPDPPSDLLQALDIMAAERTIPDYTAYLRRIVSKPVRREVKRTRKLLSNLDADLESASKFEEMRQFGNLLTTYHHLLRRGMDSITVKDYSGESEITINLDPSLTPDRNIRSYFRKARKGEKGLMIIRNRRVAIRQNLSEAKKELERIEKSLTLDDLLARLPAPRDEKEEYKKDGTAKPPFKSFRLDESHTVYVGRNDRQNDSLTHRFASPSDLWFHAQGLPGSHVVLKGAGSSTPRRLIEIAASIAAYFSKGRNSSTVPVIYTEKRYVRKPRKSRPGTASCQREKTLFVSPVLPDDDPKKNGTTR
ncbi:MAG: DUF814 domain-containing protein [Candidatus Krumholzibacteria bacterium]|nr:DUF814 domain-containing protein [Candidatus Krumholzibacteria bacterium]